MKNFAPAHLMKLKPYQPGKPIDEVKREMGLRDVVKLASNENPYPPSPGVVQAIARAARQVNRYPDGGCFYLRQALAKKLGVPPSQLVFGNGSDEIIILALRAFVSPGDEVVMAKPSFMIYALATRIAGARPKEIPLKDFRYDLDRMRRAVTRKTKLIFIGNPDNPGGTYVTHRQLAGFLKQIPRDVLVFMDEAYYEYAAGNKDYPDTLKLLKRHKNLIITRTFSKIYGLAGLRIGYGIADSPIIAVFDRIRDPFNVNTLAQAAALACLKDRSYYKGVAQKIERQRQYLYRQLTLLKIPFVETATNFVLIRTDQNSAVVSRQLMQRGVIVRDMSVWGLNDFIRVSIGTAQENRKFIRAMTALTKKKK